MSATHMMLDAVKTCLKSQGVTYAELAKESRIPEYPEDTLRLMNADYPSGEPVAGEWIKIAN